MVDFPVSLNINNTLLSYISVFNSIEITIHYNRLHLSTIRDYLVNAYCDNNKCNVIIILKIEKIIHQFYKYTIKPTNENRKELEILTLEGLYLIQKNKPSKKEFTHLNQFDSHFYVTLNISNNTHVKSLCEKLKRFKGKHLPMDIRLDIQNLICEKYEILIKQSELSDTLICEINMITERLNVLLEGE